MSGAAVKPTVARVAAHFGLPVDVLCGPSRVRSVTYARHIAMWMLRQQGLSYRAVAEALGRTDHTTAVRAVSIIERERTMLLGGAADDLAALESEA